MTRILWLSRHKPLPAQLAELRRLFPDYVLTIDTRTFSGADDILARMNALKATEIVAVAPLCVIRELCARGLEPLHAKMEHIHDSTPADVCVNGRNYKFSSFQRIIDVRVEVSLIIPKLSANPTPTCAQTGATTNVLKENKS